MSVGERLARVTNQRYLWVFPVVRSRNGVFVDDATFAFVNRNLPVPSFKSEVIPAAQSDPNLPILSVLRITTNDVELNYMFDPSVTTRSATPPPGFTPDNLYATITISPGNTVTW